MILAGKTVFVTDKLFVKIIKKKSILKFLVCLCVTLKQQSMFVDIVIHQGAEDSDAGCGRGMYRVTTSGAK